MRIRSGNAAQAVQRKNTKISEAISFARYKEDKRKESAIAAIATQAAQRNTARTRAAQRNKARDSRAISLAQEEGRKISAIAAVSPQEHETLFEMQATMQNRADFDDEPQFFDAVSDFSSGSQTTIGTQTYWSFGPNLW